MRAAVIVLIALAAAAQAPTAEPALYFTEAALMATLKEAEKTAPAMHTAPVKLADHYRINIVRRTTGQGAIAHPDGTEVHHIIEGAATFVTGGTIVRAAGTTGAGTSHDRGTA